MSRVADYLQISKPRILLLLLIVAWASMFVAADGLPTWQAFTAVTLGGAFSTAASGAFNNILERDRDAVMDRTADRPIPAGRITVRAAYVYAGVMAVASFVVLFAWGFHLAAYLNAGAIAYYVVVYTVMLKPTTPQNIVIGGFAGSFPALIGWAAVTGTIGWPAVVLAALVFLWTPAHFWALALLYKDDYAAAAYPMMPNVRGEASTRRQVVVYAVLTAAASFALLAFDAAGWLYVGVALLLGGVLVLRAIGLTRKQSAARYRSFFLYTIQYLGFLLLALMADRVLPQPAFPF